VKIKFLILSAVVLVLFGGFVFAQGTSNTQEAQEVTANTSTANAVEVGNKICPVAGNKVTGVKILYKGKIYNLCCSMCIQDFKNDPEKYSAIADKEVSGK